MLIRYCVMATMLWASIGQLHAAESGPRAYQNVPTGINLVQLYYKNNETRGSQIVTSDLEVLRYYRYFDFFGNVALVGGYLPFAQAKLSIPALGLNKETSGLADPALVFGFDFYGAPAISMDEYKDWVQETILGFSVQISVPLGRYNKTSILNLGANRWMFKPELAISHQFGTSGLYFETYLNYHFYTKNRAYLGNNIKDQNGQWGIDAHLAYEFMRGAFVSIDYFNTWGGETKINGVLQGDRLRDSKLGATLKMPLSRSLAAEFRYSDDLDTKSGNKTRSAQVRLQYVW